MKKAISIIFMFFVLISCGKSQTEFQKQYSKYQTEIGKTLVKGQPLNEKQRADALKIFTVKYEGENPKVILYEKKDKIKTEELRNIIPILLMANYKVSLTQAKRAIDDKFRKPEDVKKDLQQIDSNVMLILSQYGIDKISKNNPINDYGKDMIVQDYMNQLKKDIGLK